MFNSTDIVLSPTADYSLAALYTTCLLVGTPSNIFSVRHFYRQPTNLGSVLFLLTAVVDLVTLPLISIPTLYTLINGRKPGLYENQVVCSIFGMLFNLIAALSVSLLASLSFSRTYLMLHPVKRQNQKATFICMALFLSVLVLHESLFMILGKLKFSYGDFCCFCFDSGITKAWDIYDNTMDSVILALPIIPVSISCFITCYKIYTSSRSANRSIMLSPVKLHTTITVILYTLAYIIFSLPDFINYLTWTITDIRYGNTAPVYETSVFMMWYSWLITDTLMVVIVATINPLIVIVRYNKFKLHSNGVSHSTSPA